MRVRQWSVHVIMNSFEKDFFEMVDVVAPHFEDW
jgi:hypothetical protein